MSTIPLNVGIGQTTANLYTEIAYAGLKFGLDYSLTVALPYQQSDPVTAGLVLCVLPNGTGALPSVAVAAASSTTIVPFGIFVKDALLDHAPDPLFFPTGAPLLPPVISVMQRGKIWAQVTAGQTCTFDGPVKFNRDGTVSDTGAYLLPHAAFLSAPLTMNDGSQIVVVGLHDPMAA
nr:hypothetical protein [uncultured Lichenicoccus sp.]